MEKVWVVASGKGGTGKSTVVANLGAALAAEGRRVLLVDLNVGLRCLDLCLGMDDRETDCQGFDAAVGLLSRRIARMKRILSPLGLHLLGHAPENEKIAAMLATILAKPSDGLPQLEAIAAWNSSSV